MKYRSRIKLLGLILISIALQGCPYDSKVPASEEAIEVPKNLLGKWVDSDDLGSANEKFYLVSRPSRNSILINEISYTASDENYDTTRYSGQLCKIKGQLFLSLKNQASPGEQTSPFEEEEKKYYIYRVRPYYEYFKLDELSNHILEQFETSAELRKYIEVHMDNEIFYNTRSSTYIKMNQK